MYLEVFEVCGLSPLISAVHNELILCLNTHRTVYEHASLLSIVQSEKYQHAIKTRLIIMCMQMFKGISRGLNG